MISKYSISKSSCVGVMECMFFLNKKIYTKVVYRYSKQECDACNFNSDKDKVKIHNSKKQKVSPFVIILINIITQKDSYKN